MYDFIRVNVTYKNGTEECQAFQTTVMAEAYAEEMNNHPDVVGTHVIGNGDKK